MKYEDPKRITQEELLHTIEHGAPTEICAALVNAVHSIDDHRWLQKVLVGCLGIQNIDVQGAALTCIGHIARLHCTIDVDSLIRPFQEIFATRPVLRGRLEDAMDDIEVFAHAVIPRATFLGRTKQKTSGLDS